MPRVGFEPTISVFKRAKTFHVLDSTATVVGFIVLKSTNYSLVRDIPTEVLFNTSPPRKALEQNIICPLFVRRNSTSRVPPYTRIFVVTSVWALLYGFSGRSCVRLDRLFCASVFLTSEEDVHNGKQFFSIDLLIDRLIQIHTHTKMCVVLLYCWFYKKCYFLSVSFVYFRCGAVLNNVPFYFERGNCAMLGGSLVTTAWRVLRSRMEETPPVLEGSCEYVE
jgi:hypothetical protein